MRDFGYLNRKISEHIVDIEENFDITVDEYAVLMRNIYRMSEEIIKSASPYMNECRKEIYCNPYKRGISLTETIKIVLKFLNTIDENLCSVFEQTIENGTILFHSKKELEKLHITKDNFYYFYNLAGFHNGTPVVNIIYTNTISDVFIIVHEFAHYLSLGAKENKSLAWLHFTEGYSYTFEKLLYQFLKEQTKWCSEAEKYNIQNNYIMCLKSYEFRNEFVAFDIFLNYGSFTPQKVLKYCEGEYFKEKLASRILNNARISERYLLDTEKTLREYLEDSRYVLALPFSVCLLKNFKGNKEDILDDIFTLEDKTFEYFLDKYDLENVKEYQKIFKV